MKFYSENDPHYENIIFPLVKEGKDKFNWWAGLLGFFWFPYKGLWKQWWIFEVALSFPLTFLMALQSPNYPNFSLAMIFFTALLCGVLIVFLGNMSNTFYSKHYHQIKRKNFWGMGILGTVVAFALTFPIGIVAEYLAKKVIGFCFG